MPKSRSRKKKKSLVDVRKTSFLTDSKIKIQTNIRLLGLHYSASGFSYLSSSGRQKYSAFSIQYAIKAF